MAHYRIGRDDDHPYPPLETPTDDEDDGPEETSSVSKEFSSTLDTYLEEATTIPTQSPTWTKIHPSQMSERPTYSRGPDYPGSRGPQTARPSGYDEGPNDRPDGYGPPWASTTLSTRTAWGDSNGAQSMTTSSTPTRVPTDDASLPTASDDVTQNLQNHGADNGPNRAPMYAAAGVAPVVVIVIGFLIFCCLRKRRRQRQAAAEHEHVEEMKMQPKPVAMPYIAPITPPSPPPAVLPQYSPSTPSSSHPPTASSSQPIILGPIPSGDNGAYLTGMDTSDLVSMTSAGGVSRQGTVVDRDPFADGRSLEEAPPPYRPSSLPPASLASTSRNSSVRMAAPPRVTSRSQLIERSPFDDPEDDEVSELSGPTLGRNTDAMSDVSDMSYQVDPVVGRSPF